MKKPSRLERDYFFNIRDLPEGGEADMRDGVVEHPATEAGNDVMEKNGDRHEGMEAKLILEKENRRYWFIWISRKLVCVSVADEERGRERILCPPGNIDNILSDE